MSGLDKGNETTVFIFVIKHINKRILFKVCDGKNDCENGEDENGHCHDSCSMLQCSENQYCQHTPNSNGTCLCDDGYQMNDESICIDVDECQSLPPVCSQVLKFAKKFLFPCFGSFVIFLSFCFRNATIMLVRMIVNVRMDIVLTRVKDA